MAVTRGIAAINAIGAAAALAEWRNGATCKGCAVCFEGNIRLYPR
jgi:hypothetical protein